MYVHVTADGAIYYGQPPETDTDEITHYGEVVVTDGIPTHAWIARPWTEVELSVLARAAEHSA